MRDMPEAMDELPKLLAKIPKTQIELVQEFLHEVISTDVTLSTKEERSTRMELEDILSGNDVENAESIADTLVEIRVVRNVERYVPIFTGKYVDAILATALKLGQLKVNLSNIDMASEKTDRIVKALKNYSYVQSTDRLVPTDLSDSVESILTLMNNQLKYGIEVVREYANDVPEVPIYPDELGQVWTNMIGNAVQAMGESGRLTVSIANGKPGYVEVSINDNGPGIPAEIQKRIFEPFFTTKPQGQGTGLGLDISRKIIEKHQGEVRVESQPGSTTFTVSLPVNPTQHQQVLDSIPQV
jgi:signal transduction histidine kinase